VTRSTPNPWLARFAWVTAAATLGLICVGGLVTSRGAGLAVPDWPNTYGYNMFFFPISQWVGGIFYEHTHRLAAAGVGLLTAVLAVWVWLAEPRAWVRWLAGAAFGGVVLQGVLGGLRVTLIADELGVVHAALAQLFLVWVAALALFLSPGWPSLPPVPAAARSLRPLLLGTTVLVFGQLVLGALMRHQHAGLAIPDFPLAYGRLWPSMDAEAIARYNQLRLETTAVRPITAFQVGLQMAHRLVALGIVAGIVVSARRASRLLGRAHPVTRLARVWVWVVLVQFGLGAVTIWTEKSADLTTAHVGVGAVTLLLGALACVIACRDMLGLTRVWDAHAPPAGVAGSGALAARLTGPSA